MLGVALRTNTALTALALPHARIGDGGVHLLQGPRPQHPGLDSICALDLSHCLIGDAGALALVEDGGALRKNVLTTLDLSFNRITSRGAEAIADALARRACRGALFSRLDRSAPPCF